MRISFENIINKPGYIKADYKDDEVEHFIEFEMSDAIDVREDLVAVALSILCGQKYDEIHMELNVTYDVKEYIEQNSGAKLSVGNHVIHRESKPLIDDDVQTLNFSGGFDSLAAKHLMPEEKRLVTMDFGKAFARERLMFNQFDTHIVKNNILDTNFRKNSENFMFIGSVLYMDYFQTTYNITGTILGALPLKNHNQFKKESQHEIYKMKNIPYTLGLSEVGAVRVASESIPEKMSDSLTSLANPGEEKRYRKQLLLEIDKERYSTDIQIENPVDAPERIHFKWGDGILADHLSLYIMKYKGLEVASSILREIPDEAYELSQTLDLSFYDKYHPEVLDYIPQSYKPQMLNKLDEIGITVFNQHDFDEYHKVLNFMKHYYKINSIK